jgi:peptide chain release factor 1
MLDRLTELSKRYEDICEQLAQPDVLADPVRMRELGKARAELEPVIEQYRALKEVEQQIADTRALIEDEHDPEMRELAEGELASLLERRKALDQELSIALLPKDPYEDKQVIMEVRQGAGGEEAGLFAAELYRMYSRYADRKGWRWEQISLSEGELGGVKEVVFAVDAAGAYGMLKHESGVHRVQRVPVTESSGRLHTSTATVAVLPEAEEIDVDIDPADLDIETFRASTAGGQHMQKNETAVRITHLPTGMVVSCQDERSQRQNRLKAMRVLRSRLLDRMRAEQQSEITASRRKMVGTGDRSEKIRTYNFPQDRCTDHRLSRSWHNLPSIMDGEIDDIVQASLDAERQQLLSEMGTQEPAKAN